MSKLRFCHSDCCARNKGGLLAFVCHLHSPFIILSLVWYMIGIKQREVLQFVLFFYCNISSYFDIIVREGSSNERWGRMQKVIKGRQHSSVRSVVWFSSFSASRQQRGQQSKTKAADGRIKLVHLRCDLWRC